MMKKALIATLTLLISALSYSQVTNPLLFYLSGENGATADFASGKPEPNFLAGVSSINDGAIGKGFHCAYRQLMAYTAPGNIYADKGTLSFFWRSAEPFTKTEFPIFRVSFADHTSWDMVWLRIDYNGSGFEAFVTDNNLARIRVKKEVPHLPAPDEWVHIAVSWDEGKGVKLYLNGELAARRDTTLTLNTGLDQFGPHSRIISPYQVQSAYNMQRGGDIDEIRIYDHMLSDRQIAELAKGNGSAAADTDGSDADLEAWLHFMGFDGANPPYLENRETVVRKVGINETYDVKRWYWKSNDGIRETTWPGVYNLSKIEGRTDYFVLPDWDCYSTSGKQVRFNMPDEEWNYIQVTGGAYGEIGVSEQDNGVFPNSIGVKEKGTQRSFHMLDSMRKGKTITFTNVVQETPIQEFDVFNVHAGRAPQGSGCLSYVVGDWDNFHNPTLIEVEEYVKGRFRDGARSKLLAMPAKVNPGQRGKGAEVTSAGSSDKTDIPIAHIVIPNDFRDLGINRPLKLDEGDVELGEFAISWNSAIRTYSWTGMQAGLDGIRIELPALNVNPAGKDGLYPINIQVKDPVWKLRNMLDFSFSVKPGEARTLWLDLRDRILPDDKPIYITISGASPDFNASQLKGMKIDLIFKPYGEAAKEHVEDRLTQVKDTYAMICEENTTSRKLGKYRQFEADIRDLIKVDPDNELGRKYWYIFNPEQIEPAYTEPTAPEGVPEWAFVQLEVLKQYREIIEWFIDKRQIENGEFGGGISDDTDLTNWFPALIQMGSIPEKAGRSLALFMEAIYDQKTLTDGISTIQTDGLHTYEEGENTVCQTNVAGWGNPLYAERMMETARTLRDRVIGVNEKGHTHFRSDYFSATRIADEGPWTWSSTREYFHTGPALLLGEFYGNLGARSHMIDFANSVLAHALVGEDGKIVLPGETNFLTDEVRSWESRYSVPMMWYAWLWTGDRKYLKAVQDSQWMQPLPTESESVTEFRKILKSMDRKRDIITEGSVWIDRLSLEYALIQTVRMGGICMDRSEHFAPFNLVSWRFPGEYDAEKMAILFTENSRDRFSIKFFNTGKKAMTVMMQGQEIPAGRWQVDRNGKKSAMTFGRGRAIEMTIPAGKEYILTMELDSPAGDFNTRTDLAISKEDISVGADGIKVTVHNISGQDSPETTVAAMDRKGRVIAEGSLPSIPAPNDLIPKTASVNLSIPAGTKPAKIVVNPGGAESEIYITNNTVIL